MRNEEQKTKIVIDLDEVMNFIFAPDEKRCSNLELEETYLPLNDSMTGKLELAQRLKRELKNGEHSQHEVIRTNMVNRLLDEVGELEVEDESIIGEYSFGEELAFNTLLNYGFIKVV
jgi:hypothetical protein